MNTFKGNERLKYTFIIHKDFAINAESLQHKIKEQISDKVEDIKPVASFVTMTNDHLYDGRFAPRVNG